MDETVRQNGSVYILCSNGCLPQDPSLFPFLERALVLRGRSTRFKSMQGLVTNHSF